MLRQWPRRLSRRALLKGTGQAGLAALALTAGSRALLHGQRAAAQDTGDSVRELHLEARQVMWELAPGKRIKAMTYNGQVPGPELRLHEGERVRVIFTNRMAEPTTLHWHGVDVPNAMDGVPGLTQKPVAPGETFVYKFEARPAGTRWYHTHFASATQLDLGLYAPLIIEPAQSDPFPFDREYTLVLDDWATGKGPALPRTVEGTARARGSMGGMMGRGMGGMMERMMNRRGMMGRNRSLAYDTMTINGKAYPATEPLLVDKGERVHLRLINASADHTHIVRLAGHRLQVTHTDGNPLAQPVEVDTVPVTPSERYDVQFVADHPGAWLFSCAEPGHAHAGEQVRVVYQGHENASPVAPEGAVTDGQVWHYGLGHGRTLLPSPSGQAHAFDLTLSGGMMGSDAWTINGQQYPEVDPLRLPQGDLARVRFRNHSMEAHPMHLHGQSFRVLTINGRSLAEPLVKDSVDVEAHMGAVEVEFVASNPGDWLLHCHKPMHMEGGMMTLVQIS